MISLISGSSSTFSGSSSLGCSVICYTILTIYGTPSLHHKLKMVSKKLFKNRAGFGNHLLHGLSNVQAEFGNEVVDSEINVSSFGGVQPIVPKALANKTKTISKK